LVRQAGFHGIQGENPTHREAIRVEARSFPFRAPVGRLYAPWRCPNDGDVYPIDRGRRRLRSDPGA
jgi:hypothetical protein